MAEVKIVDVPRVVPGIQLTLDMEEAKALRALVGMTLGSNYHSRRGYIDKIYKALYDADVPSISQALYNGSTTFITEPGLEIK